MVGEWIEPLPSNPLSADLPPREVRKKLPVFGKREKTPVDSNGLVDHDGLVTVLFSNVEDGYNYAYDPRLKFKRGKNHHTETLRRWYEQLEAMGWVGAIAFYDLNYRQLDLPPPAHGQVHDELIPADPPKYEVIDAVNSVHVPLEKMHQLVFGSKMAAAKASERGEGDFEQMYHEHLNSHMHEFGGWLEAAMRGAPEFQVVDYSQFSLNSTADMIAIKRHVAAHAFAQRPISHVLIQPESETQAA